MTDPESDNPVRDARRFNPRAFLAREWPYLLILILALFGVAYTSFSRTPITIYWIVLAPFIGVICVVTRWQDAENREQRMRLIWTQALHWGAVLLAMHLMFVADVARMMNADASALAALTVLALGTFTAGVHIAAWRICLVGIALGVGVPAIAWLEQSTLLLLLVFVVLVAVTAPFFWHDKRESKRQPLSSK
ncbi:MAG TPA: hypothetical protein VIH98_09730 [Xanthobacteraceae bacterium]